MVLQTARLKIRYIEPDDWKDLIRIWKDFDRSAFARYDAPHALDEADVRKKAKCWAEASPQKEHMFFAVCDQKEVLGYIEFHRNSDGYECGYCFHSKFHGRGYAKESMQMLMEWLSNDGCKRFVARTALDNLPSVKLLASLGFRKTGEERVSFYKDGTGADIYLDGGIFMADAG